MEGRLATASPRSQMPGEVRPRAEPNASFPLGLVLPLLLLLLLLLPAGGFFGDQLQECGHPEQSDARNMQDSVEYKWPWQVSLRHEKYHVCGGALVAPEWVVTAAHCINSNFDYSVMMGDTNLYPNNSNTSQVIPVMDILLHPKYRTRAIMVGNIALLRLQDPVSFSKHVHPICLPSPEFNLKAGTQCWVTGWGHLRERNKDEKELPSSSKLQESKVFIIHDESCDQLYHSAAPFSRYTAFIMGFVICAKGHKNETSCQGDPGGPLVCEVQKTWILAGVVSWVKTCRSPGSPSIYTRVKRFSKWITAYMNYSASPVLEFCWIILLFGLLLYLF